MKDKIFAVELSFDTAPRDISELASGHVQDIKGLHEKLERHANPYFILGTCQRLTVFASSSCPGKLIHFFEELNIAKKYLKVLKGDKAVQHLLAIAGGLKSPNIGENEILHQLKNVLKESNKQEILDVSLQKLLHKAIETGKRIRTETSILKNNLSYPGIAYKILKERGLELDGKNVLVIGNGKLGKSCINYFLNKKALLTLATRNPGKKADLKENVKVISRDEITNHLSKFDVIIGAASTKKQLITKSMFKNISDVPVFIDLAMPANFDPSIQLLKNNTLFNLEYIFEKGQDLKLAKSAALREANKIVAEETESFVHWLKSRKAVRIISTLKKELELIKNEEQTRLLENLGEIDFQQKKMIDNLVNRLTSRIAHTHYSHIKNFVVHEQS